MRHALVVAAILALGLTACSKKEEPPPAPAPAPAAAPAPEAASGTAATPAEQKPEEKK